MHELKTLTIRFDAPLSRQEVPLFRGAVLSALLEDNVLFHNHLGGSNTGAFRYSYPLIQYKSLNGKAAIICIGEGLEAVWDFFKGGHFDLRLGRRKVHIMVEDITADTTDVETDDTNPLRYHIVEWLPLNEENYTRFQETATLTERISLLESILRGNILSMLKGCGIYIEDTVTAQLESLSNPRPIRFKGVPLLSFDAAFLSNLQLPTHIGLGRHVSVGFGDLSEFDE